MRGGGGGGGRRRRVGGANGGPPTDLLVCFPTRAAHLTLMPKPMCSPSRPPPASIDQTKSSSYRHHQNYNPSRPLFRTSKAPSRSQIGSDVSEPTSPKVTCAGQIKVRPRNGRAGAGAAGAAATAIPDSKSNNWLESVGIKKDVMNFLGTLRSLRFNMGCFGAFNAPIVCTSDEEDEEEEEEEEEEVVSGSSQCRTIFSKWFMVLEESQGKGDDHDNEHDDDIDHKDVFAKEEEEKEEVELPPPPPKNALLLMRCRSAPAKRRELQVERKEEEEEGEGDEERLMLMSYAAPDFFKVSTDIAKETWLVGSLEPMLARSRSWRR